MKITFLKKHDKYLPGDEADISDAQANYLIRMQVAKEVKSVHESLINVGDDLPYGPVDIEPEKVEMKPTKEKNDKAGPGKKKKR